MSDAEILRPRGTIICSLLLLGFAVWVCASVAFYSPAIGRAVAILVLCALVVVACRVARIKVVIGTTAVLYQGFLVTQRLALDTIGHALVAMNDNVTGVARSVTIELRDGTTIQWKSIASYSQTGTAYKVARSINALIDCSDS